CALDAHVARDGLREHLDERAVLGRRWPLRRIGELELRARRAADGVRVDEDTRAAANADADVAGDGAELEPTLQHRFVALVAGDGIRADRVVVLSDVDVARD